MRTFWLLPYFFAISKVSSDEDLRIIEGEEVDITKAPYTASIKITSQLEGRSYHCSGVIIGHREILTSAHCISDKLQPPNAYTYFIRAGSSHYHKGGIRRRIDMIGIHPWYQENGINFDLAVLRLDLRLEFTDKLKPIKLAHYEPQDGQPVAIFGWGETNPVWSEGNELAPKLNTINISVWHKQSCRFFPAYQVHEKYLNDVVVCVKNVKTNNQIPCRGDSGSPVVYKDELVGILSGSLTLNARSYFNSGKVTCNDPSVVGIYNSVVHQQRWIEELLNISQSMPTKVELLNISQSMPSKSCC